VDELKFRNLPGFSNLFVDYVEGVDGVQEFFPCRPELNSLEAKIAESLRAHKVAKDLLEALIVPPGCNAAAENTQRLLEDGASVVLASQIPGFMGGSLAKFLKCLTAVRLAGELTARGVPSVPVCWLESEDQRDKTQESVNLLDPDGKLRGLVLQGSDSNGQATAVPPDGRRQVDEFFRELESLLQDFHDFQTFEVFRQIYGSGLPFPAANGRVLTTLLGELGLVVLSPEDSMLESLLEAKPNLIELKSNKINELLDARRQKLELAGYGCQTQHLKVEELNRFARMSLLKSSILPVVVMIADPCELESLGLVSPIYAEANVSMPNIWPRSSMTILDGKMRKILEKYQITIADLLLGREAALQKTGLHETVQNGLRCFERLSSDLAAGIDGLEALAAVDDRLRGDLKSAREKMLYQVEKLRERFITAGHLRIEAAERHLDRLSSCLAPQNDLQENVLSMYYFLMRHSRMIISLVCSSIDLSKPEHQTLFVD
jgi:bacillithiol synthase